MVFVQYPEFTFEGQINFSLLLTVSYPAGFPYFIQGLEYDNTKKKYTCTHHYICIYLDVLNFRDNV